MVAKGKDKIKLAVLFGGRSGEHEISIISARSMMAAVDGKKFEVLPIYISPEGSWYFWAGFMQGVARPDENLPMPQAGNRAVVPFREEEVKARCMVLGQ